MVVNIVCGYNTARTMAIGSNRPAVDSGSELLARDRERRVSSRGGRAVKNRETVAPGMHSVAFGAAALYRSAVHLYVHTREQYEFSGTHRSGNNDHCRVAHV